MGVVGNQGKGQYGVAGGAGVVDPRVQELSEHKGGWIQLIFTGEGYFGLPKKTMMNIPNILTS